MRTDACAGCYLEAIGRPEERIVAFENLKRARFGFGCGPGHSFRERSGIENPPHVEVVRMMHHGASRGAELRFECSIVGCVADEKSWRGVGPRRMKQTRPIVIAFDCERRRLTA